eukprot:14679195-Alexandrium_andersonii.AAC.1
MAAWIEVVAGFCLVTGKAQVFSRAADGEPILKDLLALFKGEVISFAMDSLRADQRQAFERAGSAPCLKHLGFCSPLACTFAAPSWSEGQALSISRMLLGLRGDLPEST